jgi:putative transcriptional regulator
MDIKSMRQKLGLTQEKFAQVLGVTFGTVNRWEKGKTKPSPLAVEKMKKIERDNEYNSR